ncbi:MAG TPA: SDR family NAD(P)-dependent oxidoreductase [Rhodospirillales bacterium]|jgi:short-subunit dehydrogenase|nr:SDR family NAD(P)-dependent oxidoreductase [Rhodospirillales bacterium]
MSEQRNEPRSILITGASSGIGAGLARLYAGPGISLAISGRDKERLLAVAETCRRRGAQVIAEVIDVKDRNAMAKWIERVDGEHPLDLVVANAGISGGAGGHGEDEDQVREIFAVNMAGVLNTVLPTMALMRQRKSGQIAIMSSLAGFIGLPGAPAYSASKAAVKVYGEALHGWLKVDNIRVSVICPGYVKTRITANNAFPMPFLMTADKAARKIKHGLSRDKARIAFPLPMAAVMWLIAALPAAISGTLLRCLPKKK